MAKDDPLTVAEYANHKGILDEPRWKRFKHLARNTKKINQMLKQVQLDIDNDNLNPEEFPNLTPQFEDDFHQNVSIEDKGKNWTESPFSKGYYKLNNKVTDFIKNNDLFIYKEITH